MMMAENIVVGMLVVIVVVAEIFGVWINYR